MYDRLSAHVTFVSVYISEAHADDEWRLRGSVTVNQPKTTAERVEVARRFQAALNWRIPLLVDPPETNAFERLFAPWPVRFYIVDAQGIMHYIAEPVDGTYDILELEERLGELRPPHPPL